MTKDMNECRLSGTIDRVKQITTRSGAVMAEVLLKVRQDKFRITAHGNVAEHLVACAVVGGRLSVTGSLSASNWKDEATGQWRNSFAVTAWAVEIGGEQVAYQKERKQTPRTDGDRPPAPPPGRRDRYRLPTAGPDDPF